MLADIGNRIDQEGVVEHQSQMILGQVDTALLAQLQSLPKVTLQLVLLGALRTLDKSIARGKLHLHRPPHVLHVHRTPNFKPVAFLTTG